MKKIKAKWSSICACIALLCMVQYSYGQAVGTPYIPESLIPFSFLSGGTLAEVPQGMDRTADGGYIVIGAARSSNTGDVGTLHGTNEDYWIVKYNSFGKIEWQKVYGGNSFEQGVSIKQTSDGGYIAIGHAASNSNGDVGPSLGSFDIWVLKLSSTGNITWKKNYGGSANDYGRAVLEISDGYIISGVAQSTNIPGKVGDIYAAKIDFAGNLVWQQTYANPGPNRFSEGVYSMAATSDGTGYILAGYGTSYYSDPINGRPDAFIMKINLTGVSQWKRLYGGNQEDYAFQVSPTSDGGCIVVGHTYSSANGDVIGTNHGARDIFILRLNSAGGIVWQQLYGGAGEDYHPSAQVTADGGIIVATITGSSASGNVTGTTHGGGDIWVLKLASTGTIEWQKLYGGSANDGFSPVFMVQPQPLKIMQTAEGGYIVVGTSISTVSGGVTDTNNGTTGGQNTDYWLFKLDANGNIVWVPNVGQ